MHYYSSSARDALHVTSALCRELWNIAKRQVAGRGWEGVVRNSRSATDYTAKSARAAVKGRENLPRNFGRANTDFTVDVSRREMSQFFLPALWIIISLPHAERSRFRDRTIFFALLYRRWTGNWRNLEVPGWKLKLARGHDGTFSSRVSIDRVSPSIYFPFLLFFFEFAVPNTTSEYYRSQWWREHACYVNSNI